MCLVILGKSGSALVNTMIPMVHSLYAFPLLGMVRELSAG